MQVFTTFITRCNQLTISTLETALGNRRPREETEEQRRAQRQETNKAKRKSQQQQ
ncbi:MAG: hypothetical protein GY820_25425 [Gammaproteobacteria bacterium]|nr:hypothetical protein [Gammaproteobacteria bacterium]